MAKDGHFFWNELITDRVDAAKSFYSAVLGWTFEASVVASEEHHYWVAKRGDVLVGGLTNVAAMSLPPGRATPPAYWLSYIGVKDIAARLAGVEAAGGAIIRPPFDIPTVGRIAILSDGGGATIGWIQTVGSPE